MNIQNPVLKARVANNSGQDYLIDMAGIFHATQYMYDFTNVQGIIFPTKRRAYKRGADGKPLLDELMISIDLEKISTVSRLSVTLSGYVQLR